MKTIGEAPLTLVRELQQLISSVRFASDEASPAAYELEDEASAATGHKGYEAALNKFTREVKLDKRVLSSLKRSPTFRGIARVLNESYVPFDSVKISVGATHLAEDGTIESGPLRGRRVLLIARAGEDTGSRFVGAGGIEIATTGCPRCDFIFIRQPSGEVVPPAETIAALAHEAIHAVHQVCQRSTKPACRAYKPRSIPSTKAGGLRPWADLVRFDIEEEAKTRELTRKILDEIARDLRGPRRSQSDRELASAIEEQREQIRASIPEVERSFFPSKLRATYLETFVFMHLIREQLKFEGALYKSHKIVAWNRIVDRIKLGEPLELFVKAALPRDVLGDPVSKIAAGPIGWYFDLRLLQRVIDARWRETDAPAETILQAHAKALFPLRPKPIRYTDLGSRPAFRFYR